jgi:DNA-binding response OmpR family regulator
MENQSILVVDDDQRIADTLKHILTYEGFDVHWADTGQKGLELAFSRKFDLILLDINLPDMWGFDICRQLRIKGKKLPIMMMSFENQEPYIVRGLKAGANDYITKPFGVEELVSRVQAHLHWQQVYSGQVDDEELIPKSTRKKTSDYSTPKQGGEDMPLLTRLAIRNGNKKRKNSATHRIEALDRAKVNRWNKKISTELDNGSEQDSGV